MRAIINNTNLGGGVKLVDINPTNANINMVYVNGSSGYPAGNNLYVHVAGYDKVSAKMTNGAGHLTQYLGFYDADLNAVAGTVASDDTLYQIPEGAVYLRFATGVDSYVTFKYRLLTKDSPYNV